MDAIDHLLARLLLEAWAVPALVALLAAGCVAILWTNDRRHHRGLTRALRARLAALAGIEEADDAATARARFADDFAAIDAAMRARDGYPALVHAWADYADTIVDPDAHPIAATGRLADRIEPLGDETRVLAWWANLYVAFGLTFTFLGIVAALTATTDGIREAGGDAARMGLALTTLLTLTAAKFWTSIAGVAGSIVLRFVDRRWHAATRRRLARVAAAVERGTLHRTAERIAIDQLRAIETLAARPAAGGGGDAAGLRAAVADAMGEGRAAMRGLFIDFASAVEGVHAAFERLRGQVETLGDAMAARAEAAAAAGGRTIEAAFAASGERFESANADLAATLGDATRRIAALAEAMARSTGAVGHHADGLDAAAGGLRDAAAPIGAAAQAIARAVERSEALLQASQADAERTAHASQAAARALGDTAAAAERAWADYAGRFAEVDQALAAALERIRGASADHADALNAQIGRIDTALAQSVDRLHGALDAIAGMAGDLEDARARRPEQAAR